MTPNEIQLTARLHTLEVLLSQSLSENFRQYNAQEKGEVSARMRESVIQTVLAEPPLVQTAVMQNADRILKKAVMDSL